MEDQELIRKEMEDKRTSLTEKLETLEDKVVDTVKEATAAVSETVETIKETVEGTVTAVKDTVENTVETVKEGVQQGVETVKDWFDLEAHVRDYPWLMLGGSVALGYVLGRLFPAASVAVEETSPAPPPPTGNGHARHHPKREHRSAKESSFAPEIAKLKGLALGALVGTVRDMVLPSLPESYRPQVKELADSVTRKLGGEPVAPARDRDKVPAAVPSPRFS